MLFCSLKSPLPSKLCRPVEILDIETDRIEADNRLVLRGGERHCCDPAEPSRAGLLALSISLVFCPIDLEVWFESATMLLTSMATVADFAFSNGELPRNQALTFSVDGSEVRKCA